MQTYFQEFKLCYLNILRFFQKLLWSIYDNWWISLQGCDRPVLLLLTWWKYAEFCQYLSHEIINTGYCHRLLTYHQITTFCVEWKLVYWFRYTCILSFYFFSSQGLIVLWKTRCSWQLLTSNDLAYQACITWRQGLVSQKLYELTIEISLK